jgi:hypothetical protein
MNLTTATPVEIDTVLAELFLAQQDAEKKVTAALKSVRQALGHRQTRVGRYAEWPTTPAEALDEIRAKGDEYLGMGRTASEVVGRYDAALKVLTDNRAAQAPLHAEFNRRGGWTRLYEVSGGHIHRDDRCSTLHRGKERTPLTWLVDLAGTDLKVAIAELAQAAHVFCSVCIPDAPVAATPAAPKPTAEQVAARKAEAARQARINDEKLIADVDGEVLKVDGDTLKTVRTAEMKAVDLLWWSGHRLHNYGATNAEYEAGARKIAAALAHKRGTTVADELATITAKAVKKIRKDFGAELATAAAAVWAAQAEQVTALAAEAPTDSTPPAAVATPAPTAPQQPAGALVDVDGRPISPGVLVECVGTAAGVLTGQRGRVEAAGRPAGNGPGWVELSWPRKPWASRTTRSALRVRVIDPATMQRATIGRGETVHAYDATIGHAGCGYFNRTEARVVQIVDQGARITCRELGCRPHAERGIFAQVDEDQGDEGQGAELAEFAGEHELVDVHGEVWYRDEEPIADLYRCVGHEGPPIPLSTLAAMLGPLRVSAEAGQ